MSEFYQMLLKKSSLENKLYKMYLRFPEIKEEDITNMWKK